MNLTHLAGQFRSPVARASQVKSAALQFSALWKIKDLDSEQGHVRLRGKTFTHIGDNKTPYFVTHSIVWDPAKDQFILQMGYHYSSNGCLNDKTAMNSTAFRQKLDHGTVLTADFIEGAVVDQENGIIRFPNGAVLEGKTGTLKSRGGKVVSGSRKASA